MTPLKLNISKKGGYISFEFANVKNQMHFPTGKWCPILLILGLFDCSGIVLYISDGAKFNIKFGRFYIGFSEKSRKFR